MVCVMCVCLAGEEDMLSCGAQANDLHTCPSEGPGSHLASPWMECLLDFIDKSA